MTANTSIVDALATAYVAAANESNALAEQAAEMTASTAAKDIREFRQESDDERVVAFRKYEEEQKRALAEAREAIDKYIAGKLSVSGDVWDESTTDAKREEHKALRGNARKILNTLKEMSEAMGLPMPEVPELLNFSGKAPKSGGGSTTGIKRPRFDAIEVNGEPVEKDGKTNLSLVSQHIKSRSGVSMSASEILAVFEEEYGTSEPAKLNGESVTITTTDDKDIAHEFVVTVYKDVEPDAEEVEESDEE